MTSRIFYTDNLRTQATHLQSGAVIITDAPVDNQGKGEAFSPTDLVATALGSCMLTIMGIAANKHELNIAQTQVYITKIMQAQPRRIAAIEVSIIYPDEIAINLTDKARTILQNAAKTCPVALSLHPDIEIRLNFVYGTSKV
ncbi:MAG: OsmC family protein [Sphingobacteriales bacterium]|jgi:putative redox protein|nr:OsmC family protein [Sphingobacteriales bacterium]MBP9140223.1 OsmC family protein [Chitinophagales bacterium]MDA0197643.1 OsmC family protein [Bacteroidota bacterium]MBK6888998.1 OsmC family protein [Sphingobacteriales bacterium]MBK7528500.1 OsmC family protein [Sphingobacteriales bacterium]